MIMKTATPQDTFDHLFGSGATSWEWYEHLTYAGVSPDGQAQPDWQVKVWMQDGNGEVTTKVLGHQAIMRGARHAMMSKPPFLSEETLQACHDLLFAADETDFDAGSGDQLLQYLVLGEVVFG